jgi:hypothetical protein
LRVIPPDNRTRPAAIHWHACEREQMPNFEIARASPTRRSLPFEEEAFFERCLPRCSCRRRTATLYDTALTQSCAALQVVEIVLNLQRGKNVRRRRSVASQPYRLFRSVPRRSSSSNFANLVARMKILAIPFRRIHTPDTVDTPTRAISRPLVKFLRFNRETNVPPDFLQLHLDRQFGSKNVETAAARRKKKYGAPRGT